MARPTKYSEEMINLAQEYLDGAYETQWDSVIPSASGLSEHLDIHRSTVHDWANDPEKPAFSDIFDKIQAKQERILISKGLTGDFNSAIAKLALGKHGYHDKQDSTHSNPDGSAMTLNFVGVGNGPPTS